jgi:hypothetical protein
MLKSKEVEVEIEKNADGHALKLWSPNHHFDTQKTGSLKQRLELLESFLDVSGNAAEPEYLPGEKIIMDLTDTFLTSGTACVLFKLGLHRFLQSPASEKMVVLDEAHKVWPLYPSPSPPTNLASVHAQHPWFQTSHRPSRHDYPSPTPPRRPRNHLHSRANGVYRPHRPLLRDHVHRFTSPVCYNALKKHISAMDDDKAIMRQIEGLETGEALVYSPSAVLGQNEDDSLVKATGRLLRLNIRKRVTQDGGDSIMAV